MLKFLSKLFRSQEEIIIELNLSTFPVWFEEQVIQSNFVKYLPNYFQQLPLLRQELLDKAKTLREKEIPEEHQKMDHRVKTIVLGNKEHYLQAVDSFAEKMIIPTELSFTSLEDLQKAREFNQELNQRLDQFSHFTEKSYHAAKHLFYEEVDDLAKVFKEINALSRGFEQKSEDLVIMEKIKLDFSKLTQEREIKETLEKEIKEIQEQLQKLSTQEKTTQQKEESLLKSQEYQEYLNLKDKEQQLQTKIEELEREIHTFLFKLSKPLRKFQYSANDPIIEAYLTDSVKAFEEDEELKIILILETLKESLELGRISFEDKLQNNYLEQIREKERLKELKTRSKELKQEKEQLFQKITFHPAARELQETVSKRQQLKEEIFLKDKELLELQQKLQKINLKELQENIFIGTDKVFKKKIKIII
ncbi:MAG: hypothetical protein WCV90_00665 [Candidatus Woesearchaeota archaeon]|jgi:hypothetical protein